MGGARSRRVFFALWPDHESVGHLDALGRNLAGSGSRLMRPETLHLTLAFVGSVTPAQVAELEEIAAGVRAGAFDLSIDRLGFWPQRGILWAGCAQTPEPLRRLAGTLVAALGAAGFAVDHRAGSALTPHVTLARRVRCSSLPRLGTPVQWRVSEYSLVESHLGSPAARYETLANFALSEANPG